MQVAAAFCIEDKQISCFDRSSSSGHHSTIIHPKHVELQEHEATQMTSSHKDGDTVSIVAVTTHLGIHDEGLDNIRD
jgi:hypothetical protein